MKCRVRACRNTAAAGGLFCRPCRTQLRELAQRAQGGVFVSVDRWTAAYGGRAPSGAYAGRSLDARSPRGVMRAFRDGS